VSAGLSEGRYYPSAGRLINIGALLKSIKFQLPNPKFQINSNRPINQSQNTLFGFWCLELGAYLDFGAWNLVLFILSYYGGTSVAIASLN
jgi:hypothetical protein